MLQCSHFVGSFPFSLNLHSFKVYLGEKKFFSRKSGSEFPHSAFEGGKEPNLQNPQDPLRIHAFIYSEKEKKKYQVFIFFQRSQHSPAFQCGSVLTGDSRVKMTRLSGSGTSSKASVPCWVQLQPGIQPT